MVYIVLLVLHVDAITLSSTALAARPAISSFKLLAIAHYVHTYSHWQIHILFRDTSHLPNVVIILKKITIIIIMWSLLLLDPCPAQPFSVDLCCCYSHICFEATLFQLSVTRLVFRPLNSAQFNRSDRTRRIWAANRPYYLADSARSLVTTVI